LATIIAACFFTIRLIYLITRIFFVTFCCSVQQTCIHTAVCFKANR
jgi:hypothetical protein